MFTFHGRLITHYLFWVHVCLSEHITKTYLYNVDPLKPHFYIVKVGFTGVYIIFHISAQKHRLWVLFRIASPVLVRTASSRRFRIEIFQFFGCKIFSILE